MAHTYNGILFGLMEEGNATICSENEPGGHDAKSTDLNGNHWGEGRSVGAGKPDQYFTTMIRTS